jgi:DNA polymerase III alpha subunit
MKNDIFGRQILNEDDLCHVYLVNPEQKIKNVIVENIIYFDPDLEISNKPVIQLYNELSIDLENFDNTNQSTWFMSTEYVDMDIAQYVLNLCETDYELQRVGEELIKFQEREMFPLLRYCKYLVDTMRKHNVVWGVGRGSSVASYVLFLIGIHRINSLFYDLSIDEFLK